MDAFPLLQDFVEGNGQQSGLSGAHALRGSGPGATWNSPEDPNVGDNSPRGASRFWRGGRPTARRTAAGVVHVNEVVEVDVAWDVTLDVLNNGTTAWLLKVTDEGGDDDRTTGTTGTTAGTAATVASGGSRPDSTGASAGRSSTYSRDGAAAIGQPLYGPRLVITF